MLKIYVFIMMINTEMGKIIKLFNNAIVLILYVKNYTNLLDNIYYNKLYVKYIFRNNYERKRVAQNGYFFDSAELKLPL